MKNILWSFCFSYASCIYIYHYISSSIRWFNPIPAEPGHCFCARPMSLTTSEPKAGPDGRISAFRWVEPSWTLKNIQKSYRKKAGRRSNHLNNFKSCQAQEWVKGCLQRASVGARPFIFFNPATNSLGLTEPLLSDSCAQLSNWKEKPSAKGWRVVQPCVPSTSISSKRSSISSKPQINGLVLGKFHRKTSFFMFLPWHLRFPVDFPFIQFWDQINHNLWAIFLHKPSRRFRQGTKV